MNAAQVETSIQQDGLISFIDVRSYKTMKRDPTASRPALPGQVRSSDRLPMVAPGYAAKCSQIARAIQLGHKAA